MPFVLDRAGRARTSTASSTSGSANVDRFLIVTNYADVPVREWLDGRLGDDGLELARRSDRFGEIQVIEFTRTRPRHDAA